MSLLALPIGLFLFAAIVIWADDKAIHKNTHDDMMHGH
jgi:hypothetical protein